MKGLQLIILNIKIFFLKSFEDGLTFHFFHTSLRFHDRKKKILVDPNLAEGQITKKGRRGKEGGERE